jgi:repressor LexA
MTSSMPDWRNPVPYTELSERQQKIMQFLWDCPFSYPPSMREIARAVGLEAQSAVEHQLTKMQVKGWVRRHPGRPRTLEWRQPDGGLPIRPEGYLDRGARTPRTVVEKLPGHRVVQERWDEAGETPADFGSQNMVGVPMFEQMAAGDPVTANPESVGIMWLPREMVGSGVFFAVRVVGDSMRNVNIFDGDWVVARQQDEAHNGDIVVALIDEEATVKTLYRASGRIWLMPQNASYEPILGDRCRLMGKVVRKISGI